MKIRQKCEGKSAKSVYRRESQHDVYIHTVEPGAGGEGAGHAGPGYPGPRLTQEPLPNLQAIRSKGKFGHLF